MDKNSQKLESGELHEESCIWKEISWKISDPFSQKVSKDYSTGSPTFSFEGGTWKLRMDAYGETEGYIDLSLVRLNPPYAEQELWFNFCFITDDGMQFNDSTSSQIFDSSKASHRCSKVMKKSTFVNYKDIFLQNGVLTIRCRMISPKHTNDRHSHQTEENESFLGEYISYILNNSIIIYIQS